MPYDENQIATNPSTGEEIIFRGGKWMPLPKSPLSAPPPAPEGIGIGEDIKKAAIPSLMRGAVGYATTPASLASLGGDLASKAADKLGLGTSQDAPSMDPNDAGKVPSNDPSVINTAKSYLNSPATKAAFGASPWGALLGPTYKEVMDKIEEKTGPLYNAETRPGRFFQSALEMLPSAAGGGGGLARNLLAGGAASVGSEAAGQLMEGEPGEGVARFLGGMATGRLPNTIRGIRTPFPATSPERTAQADLVQSTGNKISAGQITGNRFLQQIEGLAAESPRAPEWVRPENQARGITRSSLGFMGGPNSTNANQMNVGGQGIKLGNELEDLTSRHMIDYRDAGADFPIGLENAARQFKREARIPATTVISPAKKAASDELEQTLDQINNSGKHVRMGMNGDEYQQLRSDLSTRANDLSISGSATERALSRSLKGVRDSLDEAMRKTVKGTPDEGAFDKFRQEWGAYRTIKRVLDAGGDKVSQGLLDPSAIYAMAKQKDSPLAQYAQAAQNVMRPIVPNKSGLFGTDLPHILGSLAGAAAGKLLGAPGIPGVPGGGLVEHGVLGNLVGAPLFGAGVKRAAPLLFSDPVQKYLANQKYLPKGALADIDKKDLIRILAGGTAPARAESEQ